MANKGKLFPPEIYSSEELEKLLASFPGSKTGLRNRALAATYIYSAVRCAEALDLTPRDINLDECSVLIRNGKGSKRRLVGINCKAIPFIQAWIKCRPAGGHLYCTQRGGRLDESYVRRALKSAAKRAGIETRFHVHGIRHSSIVHAVEAGLPIRMAQIQLGHASLSQTAHYLNHLKPHAVIEKMRTLAL
jgi:site-specific recombinase XerD